MRCGGPSPGSRLRERRATATATCGEGLPLAVTVSDCHTRDMTKTQTSSTMARLDKMVRDMHEEREHHSCQGYWTERVYRAGKMFPREFVPTCCGRR